MNLKCLSSGSEGNCYLLSDGNETLILDCGILVKEIKKGLNFDLSKVVGAIVTHSHQDHSLSAEALANMGIDVWQPYLQEEKVQRRYFGGFAVRCFDVPHDGVSCRGFLIEFPSGQKLLYATDFEYIGYNFKKWKINHLLIECNYQKKYVEQAAHNRSHVLRGHAELETTIGIIKANATDRIETVILCHLSKGNSNPSECIAEVKKFVNEWVFVDYARKGFEVDLKDSYECPF